MKNQQDSQHIDFQENFSTALKEFLIAEDVKQADFAKIMDISASKVSQWVNGNSMWGIVAHESFRLIYPNVNLAYFVFGNEAGSLYEKNERIDALVMELTEKNNILSTRVDSLEKELRETSQKLEASSDANKKLIDIMHELSKKNNQS